MKSILFLKKNFQFFLFFSFLLFYHSSFLGAQEIEELNSTKKIYHIFPHQLDESEDKAYATFLQKTFQKAEQEKPKLIILEINTPGGELSATLKIKNIILASSLPTVCFINKNAISAGSLLALSCDKIVMAEGALIGAATPVFQTSEGMQKAPEKVVSVGRAAWRSAAEANGKNPKIAEAFVDEKIVLNKTKDGIYKPEGTLLTLTAKEALRLKFADYSANTIREILEKENIKIPYEIIEQKPEFLDKLLAFFTNPIVSGMLLGIGFLALLYELKIPGWGVSGALGLSFITIYFVSLILSGTSGWGAPALFGFGVLLMILEIFVISGFGFSGIAGLLSIFLSIFWSHGASGFEDALWVLAVATIGIFIGLFILYKSLPALMKKNQKIFLSTVLKREDPKVQEKFLNYLNKEGVALTSLRPAGTISIEDQKIDALTQGEYIEKATKIKVIQVEGNKIVVKSIDNIS